MRRFATAKIWALVALLSALTMVGCATLTQVPYHDSNGALERVEYIDSSLGSVHRVEHFRLDGSLERIERYYTGFCHYCSNEERQQFKRLKQVDHYSPHQTLERSLEYSFSGALREVRLYRLDGELEMVDYFRVNGTVEMSEHYAFDEILRQVDHFRSDGTLKMQVFLDTEGNLLEEHLYALDGKTLAPN